MDAPPQRPGSLVRRLALALVLALPVLAAGATVARAADPVIMAAGDIACDNGGSATPGDCSQLYTSNLAITQKNSAEGLAALLAIGDLQYENASLAEFGRGFGPTWGRLALRPILHPALGNHEYQTSGAKAVLRLLQQHRRQRRARGPGLVQLRRRGELAPHRPELEQRVLARGVRPPSRSTSGWTPTSRPTQQNCILAYWHHPLENLAASAGRSGRSSTTRASTSCSSAISTATSAPRAINPNGSSDPNGPREVIVGTGGKSGGKYGLLKMTLHPRSADWKFVGSGSSNSGSATCHTAPPPPPPPPPRRRRAAGRLRRDDLRTDRQLHRHLHEHARPAGSGTSATARAPARPTPRQTRRTPTPSPGPTPSACRPRTSGGSGAVTRTVTVAAPGEPPPETPRAAGRRAADAAAGRPVARTTPGAPVTLTTTNGAARCAGSCASASSGWRITSLSCRALVDARPALHGQGATGQAAVQRDRDADACPRARRPRATGSP
jgi:hypothetical protein